MTLLCTFNKNEIVFFQDPLLICISCEQGYHAHCLDPPVEKRPKNWSCSNCSSSRRKSKPVPKASASAAVVPAAKPRGRKRLPSEDIEESSEGNLKITLRF